MTTQSSIPLAPRAVPLLGHTVALLRRPLDFLAGLPAHGDLVRIRIGSADAVVVCDPVLLDRVLRDDRTFDKGGPLFDRARTEVGDSLPVCPHAVHRRLRRLVQPSFQRVRMAGYAAIMTEQIRAVVDRWRDGQTLDILAETTTMASKTLVATMFSDSLPPDRLRRILDDLLILMNGMYLRIILPPALGWLAGPRYRRAVRRLRAQMSRIIVERRADERDHGDLLSTLLTARDPETDAGYLSDEEIIGQLLSFVWAGTETTSGTIAWALHLIAEHPEIERRLFAEVDAVLGGRAATHDDLDRLELTGRIVSETMRLWPAAWMLSRVTTADAELGDATIPAGATIIFGAYLTHHHPGQHAADTFDPDRWLPGGDAPQRNSYIPFSSGARKCMGDAFSLMEATLMLATIASRWRLRSIPGSRVRPKATAVLAPAGLRMRAQERSLP
ncbi:cytochrome P450 [Nocardia panacis]|uniref:cytochrome P450 n=1 Tax=Nocardia panacis TaxID=2340916 RepID=UPI001EEF89F3|nr:cytochrome P450 [Nocardia panacis]